MEVEVVLERIEAMMRDHTQHERTTDRVLGAIEAGIKSLDQRLHEHTAQDAHNFGRLETAIDKVDKEVLTMKTEREVSRQVAKSTAVKVGGAVAVALTGIAEVLRHVLTAAPPPQ